MANQQPINWNKWKDFRIRAMNESVENEYTGKIELTCSDREMFDRVIELLENLSSMCAMGSSRSIGATDGHGMDYEVFKPVEFDGDGSDRVSVTVY